MFETSRKPYVIAEIGANHNGDMDLARRMIRAAKEAGADAAKFQSWDTTLFSRKVYEENVFLHDDYRDRSDYTLKEIVEEFALSREQLGELAAYCREVGIDFASTPFEPEQVPPLVEFGAPFVKIASMDINNDRLLRKAAETGLPVVLSTGMAEMGEIDRAVATLERANCNEIVLLHCVSVYPAPAEVVNLRNMVMLREVYGCPVGYSDHTHGIEAPLAAVALGAVLLEKHFTLDRDMFGWDHKVSTEPDLFAQMVRGAHTVHTMLGTKRRVVGETELQQRPSYRRSIIAARDIKTGERIDAANTCYRRPGTGLDPSLFPLIDGLIARRDIPYDTVIALTDLTAPEDESAADE